MRYSAVNALAITPAYVLTRRRMQLPGMHSAKAAPLLASLDSILFGLTIARCAPDAKRRCIADSSRTDMSTQ